MLRHTENCVGYDVVDEENGTPTPKRGRRGRKRKMQSRKDDDDDDTGNLIFVCFVLFFAEHLHKTLEMSLRCEIQLV